MVKGRNGERGRREGDNVSSTHMDDTARVRGARDEPHVPHNDVVDLRARTEKQCK